MASSSINNPSLSVDQCFIRVLAACETMGNATNICSDKTGKLLLKLLFLFIKTHSSSRLAVGTHTENRMTVVEGWFADTAVDQEMFTKAPISESVKTVLAEHISINRSAYLVYKGPDGNALERPLIIGTNAEH